MNRQNGFANFLVIVKIFAKNMCGVVNDYIDTVSAWSMTTMTWCQCSQRLRRYNDSMVNDYAETVSA